MVNNDISHIFSFILLGANNTGKSTLANVLCNSESKVDSTFTTFGVEFYSTYFYPSYEKLSLYDSNINKIKTHIWDTGGDLTYFSIIRSYLRADVGCLVVLVYDITNLKSFRKLNEYWKIVKETYGDLKVYGMLLGMKTDNEYKRTVTIQDGQNYADKIGLYFSELSNYNKKDILRTFNYFTQYILNSTKNEANIKGVKKLPYENKKHLIPVKSRNCCTFI